MSRSLLICLLFALLLVGYGPKPKVIEADDEECEEYSYELEGWDTSSIPDPEDFISVDTIPKIVYEETPKYPQRALNDGITGYAIVQAYVAADGEVKKVVITKCKPCDVGFQQAASLAAFKRRYEPAMSNGKSIGVWIAYKVDFVM